MFFIKKFLICLIGIIVLITITGCSITENTRDSIYDSLKKQNIIDENLEFVETVTSKTISFLISSNTYYIYKDSKNNFIAIYYSSCNGDYTCDADYRVSIYNATLNKEIIYIDEEDIGIKENYYIFDDKYAENCKYNMTLVRSYYAIEKSSFFRGKYFSFELVD